jgi:cysteine desulfurase family protein (TIGR01976 family)
MTGEMKYDVREIRTRFPALASGAAFFDGPGGSQVPDVVAETVRATMASAISNRGRATAAARRADVVVVAARAAMGDLLNADPRGIVFGRSMTQLTYDFSRALAKTWAPGDEVVVSRLDHDGNVRPWVQAAGAVGATIRWVDFDPATGELTAADVAAVLSDRTRLVAVTGASNLIGTRPPVKEIAALVHQAGALIYVDGVHLTAHGVVDVADLDADFFVCSPYKFCGPHCGVLAGRVSLLEELAPDKLLPSTDEVPERFELGTLPYELLAGTSAAVDFLATLASDGGTRRERLEASISAMEEHEDGLRRQIEDRLAEFDAVRVFSRAASRTPTLLLSVAGTTAVEVEGHLAGLGVNVSAGSFYAIEASRWLGLGDDGAVRVGLALYNDQEDIDRLLAGLQTLVGGQS